MKRNDLRKKILARRDSLLPDERAQKSSSVIEHLWRIDDFSSTRTLFIYVNFRNEVETLSLISQCLDKGMRVTVPLTLPDESGLIPYRIMDPDQDLRPGYYSIPEPDHQRLSTVEPNEIDTVILPGSVFDRRGGRLGYGGGYYDRFLKNKAPQAVRIAIAFQLQVVPEVPLLPHDQRLHYLVTEKGITDCAK
ncbi:MAG: 5-formyltetrahydrofolate cyclo-ligase [Thermodesulfobacteriota bacterium]|nr:5-formyltetrahydrofolate cyclo-ligase [Thermodesulfobacteriota bacterium]